MAGLGGTVAWAGATDITAEAGMEVTSRSTLGLAGSSVNYTPLCYITSWHTLTANGSQLRAQTQQLHEKPHPSP